MIPRKIGWSDKEILLWNVAKQFERMTALGKMYSFSTTTTTTALLATTTTTTTTALLATTTTTTTSAPINLKAGLIALYDYEDDGSTLTDSHTNNIDGTNYQSVTKTTGNPGSAYVYSFATNRYSEIVDNPLLVFSGGFSIKTWVNLTSLSTARCILSKLDVSYKEFNIIILTTGSVKFSAYDNNTSNAISAETPAGTIVTGNNYFIEIKVDSSGSIATGLSIFINTVEQILTYTGIPDLTVGIANTPAPLRIGHDAVGMLYFNGKISQLGFWEYESEDDISNTLYNSGAGLNYIDW